MPNLIIIPARALEDRTLKPRDLRALMAVGYYTNSAGKGVWASQTTMAERAGMSRQQMSECLRTLQDKGYIVKRRRFHPTTGAEMTAIIDIILTPPSPVPSSGTPPVPTVGTPPVPKLGTQTTQENVTTDDTTAPVRQYECFKYLPAKYRDVVRTMFDEHGDGDLLNAVLMELGQEYPWDVIGQGVRDLRVAKAHVTARSLRAFCKGVATPTAQSSSKAAAGSVDLRKLRARLAEEGS